MSQAHPRAGFSQAASMETKATSPNTSFSAAFKSLSHTAENQWVPEPRRPGQASRGRRAAGATRPAAAELGCALHPPARSPLSPERQRQGGESWVTYDLVLAAGESDDGRLLPNLVWTWVAVDVLQDGNAIHPLGTVLHPAQVHRLGAAQQARGRFRGARRCNATRNKSPSVPCRPRTELRRVKPDVLRV